MVVWDCFGSSDPSSATQCIAIGIIYKLKKKVCLFLLEYVNLIKDNIHMYICCEYLFICIVYQIFFRVQCWIKYVWRLWEQLICSFFVMICFRIHRWIPWYISGFDKNINHSWNVLCAAMSLHIMYIRNSLRWNLLCTKIVNRYCTSDVAIKHKFNIKTIGFLVDIAVTIMLDTMVMRRRWHLVHITNQPQRFLAYVH